MDGRELIQLCAGIIGRLKFEETMKMKELILISAVIVAWFVLNRWALPSMGVST